MAYMDKIKVLYVSPNKMPKIIEIQNTLNSMRKLINGEIDVSNALKDDSVYLICNGSKRKTDLSPNRMINQRTIYGDFIIVGNDNEKGDFKTLTTEQINKYQEQFNQSSIKKITAKANAHDLVRAIIFHRSWRIYGIR